MPITWHWMSEGCVCPVQANVRLMIDAEHSYFQPAIDHAVLGLQRVFNVHKPTVFNTIQCYTKVPSWLPDSWPCCTLWLQRHRKPAVDFEPGNWGTWVMDVWSDLLLTDESTIVPYQDHAHAVLTVLSQPCEPLCSV